MSRLAVLLFVVLFAASTALPVYGDLSPARRRHINKLFVRQKALQKQVFIADRMLKKVSKDRVVAIHNLRSQTRKLASAKKECRMANGDCTDIRNLENAVRMAKAKLTSVLKAVSEVSNAEDMQRRRSELAAVNERLELVSRMLRPKPSLLPRPVS